MSQVSGLAETAAVKVGHVRVGHDGDTAEAALKEAEIAAREHAEDHSEPVDGCPICEPLVAGDEARSAQAEVVLLEKQLDGLNDTLTSAHLRINGLNMRIDAQAKEAKRLSNEHAIVLADRRSLIGRMYVALVAVENVFKTELESFPLLADQIAEVIEDALEIE